MAAMTGQDYPLLADCMTGDCDCSDRFKQEWVKMPNKFWIVVRNPTGNTNLPMHSHALHHSKASAVKEARRLAEKEGAPFFVLETVTGYQPTERTEEVEFSDE